MKVPSVTLERFAEVQEHQVLPDVVRARMVGRRDTGSVPKKRARGSAARVPVRRSPTRGDPSTGSAVETAQREASEQDTATAWLIDLLDATSAGSTEAAVAILQRLLELPPVGHDRYDAAGIAAANMICDVLDEQAASLWSDLAGPLSLDPLVDRFLPLVVAAGGAHQADLRWALEYLGDFRLSATGKARVSRQLHSMPPLEPPLTSAATNRERAERIVRLQETLVDLMAFGV